MRKRQDSKRRADEKVNPLFALALIVPPLCIGGTPPWVVPLFTGAVCLALAYWWQGTRQRAQGARVPAGLAIGVFVSLWTLCAVLPLPTFLVGILAPLPSELANASLAFEHLGDWHYVSVLPGNTLLEACRLAALTGLFFLASQQGWRRCARIISVTGIIVFVVGVLQFLADTQQIYGLYSPTDISPLQDSRWGMTATFVNHNHQAGFFLISSFASLALVLDDNDQASKRAQDERVFFAITFALQLVGVLLSYSRAGLMCAAVFHPLALVIAWRARGQRSAAQALPRWLWAGLVLLALTGFALGGTSMIREVSSLGSAEAFTSKFESAMASLDLIIGSPIFGTGRGTAVDLLPQVFPNADGHTYTHIECAPIAMLVEWGPVVGVLVLVLCARLFWGSWTRSSSLARHIALLGLLALFVQNLADFNWEFLGTTPAAVALAGALAPKPKTEDSSQSPPIQARRLKRALGILLVALIGSALAVPATWRRLRSQHLSLSEGELSVADALKRRPLDAQVHLFAVRGAIATGDEIAGDEITSQELSSEKRVAYIARIAPWSVDASLLAARFHRLRGEADAARAQESNALRQVTGGQRAALLTHLIKTLHLEDFSSLPDLGDQKFEPTARALLKLSPEHADVFCTPRSVRSELDIVALEVRSRAARAMKRPVLALHHARLWAFESPNTASAHAAVAHAQWLDDKRGGARSAQESEIQSYLRTQLGREELDDPAKLEELILWSVLRGEDLDARDAVIKNLAPRLLSRHATRDDLRRRQRLIERLSKLEAHAPRVPPPSPSHAPNPGALNPP